VHRGAGLQGDGQAAAGRLQQRHRACGVAAAEADRGSRRLAADQLVEREAGAVGLPGFGQGQAGDADAQCRLHHRIGLRMSGQRTQAPAAVFECAQMLAAQVLDKPRQRGELRGRFRCRGVGAQADRDRGRFTGMVGPGLLQKRVEPRSHFHLTRSRSCANAPRCRPSPSAP
jgi:hypothetical protein